MSGVFNVFEYRERSSLCSYEAIVVSFGDWSFFWPKSVVFVVSFWQISAGGMSVDLYGRSFDFGAPDFEHVLRIDWTGLGGKPIPLFYYPLYPLLDNPEQVFAK